MVQQAHKHFREMIGVLGWLEFVLPESIWRYLVSASPAVMFGEQPMVCYQNTWCNVFCSIQNKMIVEIVTASPAEPLELTGERYTTAASGEIKHEHFHRYFFSLQLCVGKTVLDIASGEGYGSAVLGTVAERVLGVDISPEAVNHASRNYESGRVSFALADCTAMPLNDSSVDVVVSFETLEHVPDQEKFFCEIKRVLRPHGLLVISTPNVEVYKHYGADRNPFHIKELDEVEFRAILGKHFQNYRLFGQRPVIGSAIAPEPPLFGGADRQQTFRAVDDRLYSVQTGIGPPTYFVAVASEVELPVIHHGLLDNRPYLADLYDLLQEREQKQTGLEQQLQVAATIRQGLEQQLRNRPVERVELQSRLTHVVGELESRNEELAQLRANFDRRLGVAITVRDGLEQQLLNRVCELTEIRTRLSQIVGELQLRDEELTQLRALVARIYRSNSWQVTRPMRFLGAMLGALKIRSVRLADKPGMRRLFGRPAVGDERDFDATELRLTLPPGGAGQPAATLATAASTKPETELQEVQRSGLFDEQFYCETNPDVAAAGMSPLEHFLYVGAFSGRRPNPLFDPAYYLSTYPDVAKAGVNPALHYFLSGALEGRDPSPEFDTSFYLETNPDVARSGVNPLVHFLRFGRSEGRLPLPPESAGPETELQLLQRSGLFDEQFYCEANPDVVAGKMSPLEHYLTVGAFEGRRPNPLFDSAYYLTIYPDVAKDGVNPALHYFLHGAAEGRDPSAEFDTSLYLEAHPELAARGINPLVHYIQAGANQGHSSLPHDRPISKSMLSNLSSRN